VKHSEERNGLPPTGGKQQQTDFSFFGSKRLAQHLQTKINRADIPGTIRSRIRILGTFIQCRLLNGHAADPVFRAGYIVTIHTLAAAATGLSDMHGLQSKHKGQLPLPKIGSNDTGGLVKHHAQHLPFPMLRYHRITFR